MNPNSAPTSSAIEPLRKKWRESARGGRDAGGHDARLRRQRDADQLPQLEDRLLERDPLVVLVAVVVVDERVLRGPGERLRGKRRAGDAAQDLARGERLDVERRLLR